MCFIEEIYKQIEILKIGLMRIYKYKEIKTALNK